ncbi:MAG: hypothetical protein ABIO04_08235 [Ferruginibacter sp.]
MRENRSSLLLLVSLLLFLMSFVILCTWGYNTYYKNKDDKKLLRTDSAAISKATREIANATRDSLQYVFAATINSLGNKIDSSLHYADSLKAPLDAKLTEFFTLRSEILDLMKDKNNNGNITIARQKITELQKRVDKLLGRNKEVEQENKKLYALLEQLSSDKNSSVAGTKPAVFASRPIPTKTKAGENLFEAYDLRLSALMITDNKELETVQATQTDKFVGSFVVKNNNSITNVAEMVIVILQPDGHVLQKSTWESGTFETPEGKKIYSCKMRFDYTKGEPKRLLFSLTSENYIKGNYTMQVYYNGTLIGKINKALS